MTTHQLTSPAPSRRFLVTGGSGYLGSWIVRLLLAQGHTVHATVRDLADKSRYAHLLAEPAAPGKLRLFAADLLAPRSYDEAMAGCDVVIHTASPFAIQGITDACSQLIEPAVKGTRNVLDSATRTASVRRVVLTSSAAAIYGDASDRHKRAAAFTEADWNTTSTEEHHPYPYSKTLAEREAWRIAGEHKRWDLVVLNPGFILGPAVNSGAAGVSQTIMRNFGDGTFKNGMIDVWYGFVDVRDAAQAHLHAACPPCASSRYIISGASASLLEVAGILRAAFGRQYPIPKRKAPKTILWLFPSAFGFTRRYVASNVGIPLALDNRSSLEHLQMSYRPLRTTVIEHFQRLFSGAESRAA